LLFLIEFCIRTSVSVFTAMPVGITILINIFMHVRKIFGQDILQGKIVIDVMVKTDLRFNFYRKSYNRFTIR
jgi:hypothetical protein